MSSTRHHKCTNKTRGYTFWNKPKLIWMEGTNCPQTMNTKAVKTILAYLRQDSFFKIINPQTKQIVETNLNLKRLPQNLFLTGYSMMI